MRLNRTLAVPSLVIGIGLLFGILVDKKRDYSFVDAELRTFCSRTYAELRQAALDSHAALPSDLDEETRHVLADQLLLDSGANLGRRLNLCIITREASWLERMRLMLGVIPEKDRITTFQQGAATSMELVQGVRSLYMETAMFRSLQVRTPSRVDRVLELYCRDFESRLSAALQLAASTNESHALHELGVDSVGAHHDAVLCLGIRDPSPYSAGNSHGLAEDMYMRLSAEREGSETLSVRERVDLIEALHAVISRFNTRRLRD